MGYRPNRSCVSVLHIAKYPKSCIYIKTHKNDRITPPPRTGAVFKVKPQASPASTASGASTLHNRPATPTKKPNNVFNKTKKSVVGSRNSHKKDITFCHKKNGESYM